MALIPNEPRQRNALLIGLLAVALFYAFYAYWYTPRNTEMEDLEAQLGQLDLNNQRAQIISARGGTDLQERLALYERHVGQLEELIPEQEEFFALLNEITAESRSHGVEIVGIDPAVAEPGAFYTREVYDLQLIGDYHDIGRFLSTIASLPRIITPSELDLSVFDGAPELLRADYEAPLTASLRIQTYILPSGDFAPVVEGGEGVEGGTV